MIDAVASLPVVKLKKNEDRRIKQGHLWIYSNEINTEICPLKEFGLGQQVTVESEAGKALGIGYINPNSLICVRLLSRNIKTKINVNFFKKRIQDALALRELNFQQPFYRLVFGESDGLPGLILDRFGEVYVAQITTVGMEQFKSMLVQAIEQLLQPQALVFRNDTSAREQEGLNAYSEVALGKLPDEIVIEENDTRFYIPVEEGQKTGWFYDHRQTRKFLQPLVKEKRVLDVFSYLGGWGLSAATAGAKSVACVDASAFALDLLEKNAKLNHVSDKVTTYEGNAFDVLKLLISEGEKFDVVVVDPPAFIKKKKDIKSGTEAYRRLNELALRLVDVGGILVSASCSYHLKRDVLLQQVQLAARHLDRSVQLFAQGHQASDHPVHPAIEETDYLKSLFFRVQKSW